MRKIFLAILCFVSYMGAQEPPVPDINVSSQEIALSRKISIVGKNIPLTSVVQLISEETGLGYYIDPGLDNIVIATIDFKNSTAQEILEFLEGNYDLVYKVVSGKILLKKFDTWTFEIGLPPRSAKSSTVLGGSVVSSSGLSGTAEIRSEFSAGQSDIYSAIEKDVKSLMTEGGKFSLNRSTGTLVVSDSAVALKRIKAYINKIKEAKDRKVRIEVKIMEISLDNTDSYGIDWRLLSNFSINSSSYSVNLSQNTSLSQQAFAIDLRGDRFTSLVNFLSTFGKIHVVSQPSLLLLNGETALLSVGRLLTYWELTAQAAGAQAGTPVVYPIQKNILKGLLFSVTPLVSSDSTVTLEVAPILADVSKWETYEWQGQVLQAPDVDIKETYTILKVKSGESIVLGGLITQKENKVERGIPIISKIPVIGHLFKRQEIVKERQELVIVITPTIE
ncbi:MAG: type II secretion system protein GspD [Candidatus Hydrothermia bacterium]|jgi:MSHA biogenesis protein MshL